MKMKKCLSLVAAMAAMATMAVNVSAADWSQVSYADNDPGTGQIISYDANGFEFANTQSNPDLCKSRITLDKVLKNREDYAKIRKLTWTVTYNNVSDKFTGESLSGGTYVTCTNAKGYTIDPDEWDEEKDMPIWKQSTYTVEDYCEVPEDMTLVEDGELVFMDWSYANLGDFGITVSITDFKMFDADGNEIEQIGLNEFGAEPVDDVEEGEPVDENAAENDAPATETEDTTPKTGNSVLPVAIAGLAMLGSGAAMRKKNK